MLAYESDNLPSEYVGDLLVTSWGDHRLERYKLKPRGGSFVADMVPRDKRGTAYGLYNLAFGITVFPASLLFGLAWNQFGAPTAFIASGCVSLLAIALMTTIKAHNHPEESAS